MKLGDIYHVRDYPYDERDGRASDRPAIFIREENDKIHVLLIKLTTQLRHLGKDKYTADFLVEGWEEAGLDKESLAQISKMAIIPRENLDKKIGELIQEDLDRLKENFIKFIQAQEADKKEGRS